MTRMLTKALRKTMLLGFAALGVYKAWEIANDNLGIAREKATRMKSRLEPAVRQAETDVKDASHDAAESVIDASRIAVASVAEAVSDAALGGSSNERGRAASAVDPDRLTGRVPQNPGQAPRRQTGACSSVGPGSRVREQRLAFPGLSMLGTEDLEHRHYVEH